MIITQALLPLSLSNPAAAPKLLLFNPTLLQTFSQVFLMYRFFEKRAYQSGFDPSLPWYA
jgi:hypothetical protein